MIKRQSKGLPLFFSTLLIALICLPLYAHAEKAGFCTGVTVLESGKIAIQTSDGNSHLSGTVRLYNTRDDCGNWEVNTSKWFILSPDGEKSMLATALASMAMNSKVTIQTTTPDQYNEWDVLTTLIVALPQSTPKP